MVTARYLTDKFITPRRERMKAEARAEGREEGRAEVMDMVHKWSDWNSRRVKAEDEGIPFDEPPPSSYSESEDER